MNHFLTKQSYLPLELTGKHEINTDKITQCKLSIT